LLFVSFEERIPISGIQAIELRIGKTNGAQALCAAALTGRKKRAPAATGQTK
jgi:hypothetical protein